MLENMEFVEVRRTPSPRAAMVKVHSGTHTPSLLSFESSAATRTQAREVVQAAIKRHRNDGASSIRPDGSFNGSEGRQASPPQLQDVQASSAVRSGVTNVLEEYQKLSQEHVYLQNELSQRSLFRGQAVEANASTLSVNPSASFEGAESMRLARTSSPAGSPGASGVRIEASSAANAAEVEGLKAQLVVCRRQYQELLQGVYSLNQSASLVEKEVESMKFEVTRADEARSAAEARVAELEEDLKQARIQANEVGAVAQEKTMEAAQLSRQLAKFGMEEQSKQEGGSGIDFLESEVIRLREALQDAMVVKGKKMGMRKSWDCDQCDEFEKEIAALKEAIQGERAGFAASLRGAEESAKNEQRRLLAVLRETDDENAKLREELKELKDHVFRASMQNDPASPAKGETVIELADPAANGRQERPSDISDETAPAVAETKKVVVEKPPQENTQTPAVSEGTSPPHPHRLIVHEISSLRDKNEELKHEKHLADEKAFKLASLLEQYKSALDMYTKELDQLREENSMTKSSLAAAIKVRDAVVESQRAIEEDVAGMALSYPRVPSASRGFDDSAALEALRARLRRDTAKADQARKIVGGAPVELSISQKSERLSPSQLQHQQSIPKRWLS